MSEAATIIETVSFHVVYKIGAKDSICKSISTTDAAAIRDASSIYDAASTYNIASIFLAVTMFN